MKSSRALECVGIVAIFVVVVVVVVDDVVVVVVVVVVVTISNKVSLHPVTGGTESKGNITLAVCRFR